jgi:glutamyl-Q tRNA(Asp) synthetase
LRIEDLDAPRAQSGAAQRIVATLQRFGFEWDGDIMHQSRRLEHYRDALQNLRDRGLTFECTCSRSQLEDEETYPGTCRSLARRPGADTATRLRVESQMVSFADEIQGVYRQNVATAVGDLIIRRRDQVFAYLFAVVLDDAAQGVTHVVRGADLLDNTPRQIYVQRCLGLDPPRYAHVPVLTEADGTKLAKSRRSVHADSEAPLTQLWRVFSLLGMRPPLELQRTELTALWRWGIANWNKNSVPNRLNLPLMG